MDLLPPVDPLLTAWVQPSAHEHNTTTKHTRATKLGEQAGDLQKLSPGESGCEGAGCTRQAAMLSSGSAAAEHLTNPAEGKRPARDARRVSTKY